SEFLAPFPSVSNSVSYSDSEHFIKLPRKARSQIKDWSRRQLRIRRLPKLDRDRIFLAGTVIVYPNRVADLLVRVQIFAERQRAVDRQAVQGDDDILCAQSPFGCGTVRIQNDHAILHILRQLNRI